MTLAVACTRRAPEGKVGEGFLWVMTDSRLTLGGDKPAYDVVLKAFPVGPRSAIVVAGSYLPVWVAIEAARPLIKTTSEWREKERLPPVTIWSEAVLVLQHLSFVYSTFQKAYPEARCAFIAAGFLSDGSPALVRVIQVPGSASIEIYRPAPGATAHATIGDERFRPLLDEAARRTGDHHKVASVLWDIMRHEGEPAETIGGGLSVAWMGNADRAFQWPAVAVEGNTFLRGLRVNLPKEWPPAWPVDYDPVLFGALEREHAEAPFTPGVAPSHVIDLKGLLPQDVAGLESDDAGILAEIAKREGKS